MREAEQRNIDAWVALSGKPIQNWHYSAWPDGRLTPVAIHEVSYPPAVVEQMRTLLAQAQREAAGDARTLARLGYLAAPFEPFFRESKAYQAQARGLTDERL